MADDSIPHDPLDWAKERADQMQAAALIRRIAGPGAQIAEAAGVSPTTLESLKNAGREGSRGLLVDALATNPQLQAMISPSFMRSQEYMQQNAMAFAGGIAPTAMAADPVGMAGLGYIKATAVSNSLYEMAHSTSDGKTMTYGINKAKTGGLDMEQLGEMATYLGGTGASGMVDGKRVRVNDLNADSDKVAEVVMQHARAAKVMAQTFGSKNWKEALEDFELATGNTMNTGGSLEGMTTLTRRIAAAGQSMGSGERIAANLFGNARAFNTLTRYGSAETADFVGKLVGVSDSHVGMATMMDSLAYGNQMGFAGDPVQMEAVGKAVGSAYSKGDQTSGGRAIRMFQLLSAQGDISQEKKARIQKMLDQGNMEGFTREMQDVGRDKFGSAARMDQIVNSQEQFNVYEADTKRRWREEGERVKDTDPNFFKNKVDQYELGTRQTFASTYRQEQLNNQAAELGVMALDRAGNLLSDYGVELSDDKMKKIDSDAYTSTRKKMNEEIYKLERGNEKDKARARVMRSNLYKMDREYKKTGSLDDAIGALDDSGEGLRMASNFQLKQAEGMVNEVKAGSERMLGFTEGQVEEMWDEFSGEFTEADKSAYQKHLKAAGGNELVAKAAMMNEKLGDYTTEKARSTDPNRAALADAFLEKKDFNVKDLANLKKDISQGEALVFSGLSQGYTVEEQTGLGIITGLDEAERTETNAATRAEEERMKTKEAIEANKKPGQSVDPSAVESLGNDAAVATLETIKALLEESQSITGTLVIKNADGSKSEADLESAEVNRKTKK